MFISPLLHTQALPTFAWSNDLLLLVHVVLVALNVAAPALQSGRRLEHVPQRLGARLAVGGEVVERGNELVTLVADVAGLLSDGLHRKLWFLFTFSFIGIKDLGSEECFLFTMFCFSDECQFSSINCFLSDSTVEEHKFNHRSTTDLEYPGYLFGISTVHVCLSDRPHMEEFAV